MKNKRLNIVYLALIQVMIFIVPLTIKEIHHHQINPANFHKETDNEISQTEKPCPICNYEFVHFFSQPIFQYSFLQLSKPLKNSELFNAGHQIVFVYYSYRAPPLS